MNKEKLKHILFGILNFISLTIIVFIFYLISFSIIIRVVPEPMPPIETEEVESMMPYAYLEREKVESQSITYPGYQWTDNIVPEEMLISNEHKGTIIDSEEIDGLIYLPYDYDEKEEYDVLVLIHGQGGKKEYLMTKEYNIQGYQVSVSTLLDNIFDKGLIKPVIVVSIYSKDSATGNFDYEKIDNYFENTLFPYMESNYEVDEWGLIGASNGSFIIINNGLDKFDYIGNFSGLDIPEEKLKNTKMKMFLALAGEYDQCLDSTYQSYISVDVYTDVWCNFITVKNYGHVWPVWLIGIYDALSIFF